MITNEWISVDERLPEHNKKTYSAGVEVLIWPRIESGTAFFGRRIANHPYFYKYGAILNDVTHWMPLPEVPDEKGQ